MKTQREQIASAVSAIIIQLGTRFSIKLVDATGEINTLWPLHDVNGKPERLLPLQIASANMKMPRYHFKQRGTASGTIDELQNMLYELNTELKIYEQHGFNITRLWR